MYSPLYNRLCGWTFFAFGIIGFTSGRIDSYMKFSFEESVVYAAVGLIGMITARIRHRDAALFALLLGVGLFFWGIGGFVWPSTWIGTSEPLESAVRLVAGMWGMYTAVNDVLVWRSTLTRSA